MEPIEMLKNCLLHNNPSLFIGAGFSLGALKKDGLKIPGGDELKRIIITEILGYSDGSSEYIEFMAYSLSRVCSITVTEKGETRLYEFLKSVFLGATPQEYHRSYVKYPWYNIYSTNIDDIIEESCKLEGISLLVQNKKQRIAPKERNSLVLFKLHGCINNISEGLIFDEEDYIDSILDREDYRFCHLSIEIQNRDFIFVGSNFSDFNIKYYLNLYNSSSTESSRGTLFFINPYPSYAFKSDVKKVGGVLIEYTTQQFADFIESLAVDLESINTTKFIYDGYVQLREIKKNNSHFDLSNKYNSNLYLGAPPKWGDIFYDWDIVINSEITTFLSYVEKFEKEKESLFIYALYGKGYSSKSVILKRFAHTLFDIGYEVISYEGKSFDYVRFMQYLDNTNYSKYALIIDDASYLYGKFDIIYRQLSSRKKLCIISTSRSFFHSKRRYSLANINCVEHELKIQIDDIIAREIIDRLTHKGYLGLILPHCPDRHSQVMFVKRYPDIASAIFAITYGIDFQNRFSRDVEEILKDGYYRDALLKLAIFQRMQLAYFPRELFVKMYRNRTNGIIKRVENVIRESDSQKVVLKNDFIADIVLKRTRRDEVLRALKDLLICISSMVENSSSSYWNEMQSVLMRDKLVNKYLKIRPADFKSLLYEIKTYYAENYNYWLQLGIAEQLSGAYDKALIHFTHAQTYGPRSYMVKNAIGRNYIYQAEKESNIESAKLLFQKGKEILFDLIENRDEYQARAYSTHTYIAGLMKFYRSKPSMKAQSNEIEEAQAILNKVLERYREDSMFEDLNSAFTTFKIRYAANSKFDLRELQSTYNNRVGEVDFVDID